MKTVEISNTFPNLSELLRLAGKENIILKTLDGREFVLAEIDDFDREIELTRQNRELMEFLDERSKETKTYSIGEVRKQFGLK